MKIIERFDKYMEYKGLNDNKVTKQLDLSNGTIGKSRQPGRDLSERVIEKIEKFYVELNPDWLRTGRGEMILPQQEKALAIEKIKDEVRAMGIDTSDQMKDIESDFRSYVYRKDAQVSELISQNGKLIDVIVALTKT